MGPQNGDKARGKYPVLTRGDATPQNDNPPIRLDQICLFVCLFVTEDTEKCRRVPVLKLCQSPLPSHCCNSGIFRGASPRCFSLHYSMAPVEESTCNVGHGIGIWSAERHWEADPTTAGRGHF